MTAIAGLPDRVIRRIRRIRYLLPDGAVEDGGPLELALEDGQVIVFDAGPDGEVLAVTAGPWADPFAEPLSAENRRFVASAGKWAAYNMSDQPPYAALVGARVAGTRELTTPDGKLVGVEISTPRGGLVLMVEADELQVEVRES